jgi:hypothetical protein
MDAQSTHFSFVHPPRSGSLQWFRIVIPLTESMFSEVLVIDVVHRWPPVGYNTVFHHGRHVGDRRLKAYPN